MYYLMLKAKKKEEIALIRCSDMQDVYHTFLGKVRFPELSTNPFFETFYVQFLLI